MVYRYSTILQLLQVPSDHHVTSILITLEQTIYNILYKIWELKLHSWYSDCFLTTARDFPLSKVSKMALLPIQLLIQCLPSFYLGWGKVICHGVDGLPPSSAKFKNKWMYTSTPPICPNGVDRDNFIV